MNEFDNFSDFIITQTTNIFGIFFIFVKNDSNITVMTLKKSKNYDVYVVNVNKDFVDGGLPFMGNCNNEQNQILDILRKYI